MHREKQLTIPNAMWINPGTYDQDSGNGFKGPHYWMIGIRMMIMKLQ
jgi:hypothetical protein